MRIVIRKPNGDPVGRLLIEAACDADRRHLIPWLGQLIIHCLDELETHQKKAGGPHLVVS